MSCHVHLLTSVNKVWSMTLPMITGYILCPTLLVQCSPLQPLAFKTCHINFKRRFSTVCSPPGLTSDLSGEWKHRCSSPHCSVKHVSGAKLTLYFSCNYCKTMAGQAIFTKVMDAARRRGFVWPSTGSTGRSRFIDYGPLGAMLKRNIENLWRSFYVFRKATMRSSVP